MKKHMAGKSGIQIKLVRSSTLWKTLVLVVLVLSIACLMVLRAHLLEAKGEAEALRSQAAQLEQENSRLQTYVQQLGTVQGIIRIAQEELGLVQPDTIIFDPQ